VDVALGKVDYLEVLGFSDHRMTASVWYRLLNLGFHIPAAAGTDAMANFASLRGPVGTNRVYANLPAGPVNVDRWLAGLKAGRTFATNAPLLAFTLGQKSVGEELQLQNASEVPFHASLRSIVPIDHLEVVCNGKVIRDIQLAGDHTVADPSGTIPINSTGWCVLRAWNEKPTYPILDIYPYGTTSPIYINVRGATQQSPEDARYFLTWVDHIIARTEKMTDWNFDSERTAVLNDLRRARAAFAAKQ
jgi:hypothetical protein